MKDYGKAFFGVGLVVFIFHFIEYFTIGTDQRANDLCPTQVNPDDLMSGANL